MAGLIVTGIVLYLLFPDFTVLASHTTGSDPIKSLGIGLLLVVAMPAIAILTMLTILGIPLGLILFVFYFAALLVGFLVTAFFGGGAGGAGRDEPARLARLDRAGARRRRSLSRAPSRVACRTPRGAGAWSRHRAGAKAGHSSA
jgi:hypothetical protein